MVVIMMILFENHSTYSIVTSILFSVGLYRILKKSGIPGWWAFVPCAKYYKLAVCGGREPEGRAAFIVYLLLTASNVTAYLLNENTIWFYLAFILYMTLGIVSFFYMIRIYLGLIEVYGKKKRWIIPWTIFDFLPALYWGFSSKFKPLWQAEDIRKETRTFLSGASLEIMDTGLTVNLEERTVPDFFRKKYLLRDIHLYIRPGSMVLLLGGPVRGRLRFSMR